MTITSEICRRQRDWAADHSIAIERNGYVVSYQQNFYLPLPSDFAEAVGAAGGGELQLMKVSARSGT
jgi:hypothetical protein